MNHQAHNRNILPLEVFEMIAEDLEAPFLPVSWRNHVAEIKVVYEYEKTKYSQRQIYTFTFEEGHGPLDTYWHIEDASKVFGTPERLDLLELAEINKEEQADLIEHNETLEKWSAMTTHERVRVCEDSYTPTYLANYDELPYDVTTLYWYVRNRACVPLP